MSTASHDHGAEHAAELHAAELPCEPDEVPVRFLSIIVAGVTLLTLLLIGIGVWLFNTTAAAELKAKGYQVERSVPVPGAEDAPVDAAPAEGAHE